MSLSHSRRGDTNSACPPPAYLQPPPGPPVPQPDFGNNTLYWSTLPAASLFPAAHPHQFQDYQVPPWIDQFTQSAPPPPQQQQQHQQHQQQHQQQFLEYSPLAAPFHTPTSLRASPFDSSSTNMAPDTCSFDDVASGGYNNARMFYGPRPTLPPTPEHRPVTTTKRRRKRSSTTAPLDLATPRSMAEPEAKANKHPCTYEGCSAAFARQEHLKRHVQSVHMAKRTYRCPVHMVLGDTFCDPKKVPNRKSGGRGGVKDFPERIDNLNQHIRTHIWREHARNATLKLEAVLRCIDICDADDSIKKKLRTSLLNRLKQLRDGKATPLPFGKPKPCPHELFPPKEYVYYEGHPIGTQWTDRGFQHGHERICGCPVMKLELDEPRRGGTSESVYAL